MICQKRKTIENSRLDTCVVHTFEFNFMLYKCSMWLSPAVLSRYENSSQARLSMLRSTVLIADVIRSFISSTFAESGGVETLSLTYPHKNSHKNSVLKAR